MELSELLGTINIVEYISQYVDLEQRGDEWWGLSCFKEEKTPSFSVRENPPVFYDYSSGIGGNLYTFVRRYHQCGSQKAIQILKQYAGIDGEIGVPSERLSATVSCKKFAKHTKHEKEDKSTVLSYDYMERYDDDIEKLQIWIDEGISPAVLEKFQVRYDHTSDRIVYPIRDPDGKIVNIGGRTLDPEWKEKKMRKYCYFYKWGTMKTIYGLAENMPSMRDKREIILFEGCKSVLKAASWGIENTGAILTSHLNPEQMKILAKLGFNVVFALDKDVKIREDHNIAILKNYVNVTYIYDVSDLLDEKDAPVDKGEETFRKLYERRFRYR